MKTIHISTEYIKLDQLLKFAEITDSGGVAKMLISDGFVHVNGKLCEARGKKIYPKDQVIVKIPDENGASQETFSLIIAKKV